MRHLEDFLKKYADIEPSDKKVKETIIEALKKTLNIELSKDQITYNNKVLRIKASPLVRAQIHTKKAEIISYLKEHLEEKSPKDIR